MIKKILSCVMALCVAGSMSVTAFAYGTSPANTNAVSPGGVRPMYDYATYVFANIGINSDNKAVCTGSYYLTSNRKSVITMTLMKSDDGLTNWTAVESWSKTNYVENPLGYSKTSTNKLSSDYYYRNFVMVSIYDDKDNVVETLSCFSNPTHL